MRGGVFRVEAAEEVAIGCQIALNTRKGFGTYSALSNWSASDILGTVLERFEVEMKYGAGLEGLTFEIHKRGQCFKRVSQPRQCSTSTSTLTTMSATRTIPLRPLPPGTNHPVTQRNASSPAAAANNATSSQASNANQATNQAVTQVNQARPAVSRSTSSVRTKVWCWLRSNQVLVLSGLAISLAGLFVSYYPAKTSNSFASVGDDIAKISLDYTRYQTWCPDPAVGFHRVPADLSRLIKHLF